MHLLLVTFQRFGCGIFKDAVLGILATIAKQERVRLSERTLAGLAKARKEGRIGGRPKLVVDRAKAERLHASGASLTDIAAKIGASKSSVHRMLRHAATNRQRLARLDALPHSGKTDDSEVPSTAIS